jgi:hypothetical protein
MKNNNLTIIFGVIAVVALIAVAGLVAAQLGDDDDDDATAQVPVATSISETTDVATVDADDVPLSQNELNRAEAAALRIAGSGTVTDVDRSDDLDEAYEVEVVTEAGEVDIALNDRFERVPNLRYDD